MLRVRKVEFRKNMNADSVLYPGNLLIFRVKCSSNTHKMLCGSDRLLI